MRYRLNDGITYAQNIASIELAKGDNDTVQYQCSCGNWFNVYFIPHAQTCGACTAKCPCRYYGGCEDCDNKGLARVNAQGQMLNADGVTTQQANNLLSLKRRVAFASLDVTTNTMDVYEPFTGCTVKIVRANAKSRWYIYGSGKKQNLKASLFGDNSKIIYVS